MSYTNVTQAGSATPALDFMLALHPLINDHANWVYQEEVTSGAETCRVYKCLAAGNSCGTDVYLAVKRASDAATDVKFALGETYTTGGTLADFVPEVSNTSLNGCFNTPDADGTTPLAGQSVFTATHVMWIPVGTPTLSFPYWVSVTADRVVVATTTTFVTAAPTTATNAPGVYAGCFEPFTGITDSKAFILCRTPTMCGGGTQTSSVEPQWGGYTRMTIAPGASRRQNWLAATSPTSFVINPNGVTTNETREPGTLKFHLSKIACGNRYSGDSNTTPWIALQVRGWLKDVLAVAGSPAVHAKGDRYLVGAVYHVAFGYENTATNKQILAVDSSI